MSSNQNAEPFKVAIIGAGIGGATTAFYLRKMFGPQVGITLFEQSGRIGGRIKALSYDGAICETGASVYLTENYYMSSFAREFGLELDNKKHRKSRVAFFSGEKPFIFSTLQDNWLMSRIRLVYHYGLVLVNLRISARTMLNNFEYIYQLQKKGVHFNTPAELLGALDPKFVEMTKWKFGDWITKRERLPDEIKNEIAYTLVSNNYCQNLDVHAFVGMVSMASSVGTSNSVKGGNQQIPELLIQSALDQNPEGSPKEFVHAQVTSISPDDGGKYQLEYRSPETEQSQKESFDYVVIAAPLHQNSSIRALGGLTLPSDKYCSMNTTLFTGDLKHSVFGVTMSALRRGVCPFILPTWSAYVQQKCLFHSLSAVPNPNKKNHIWTVFSEPSRMPSPEQTVASNYLDLVDDAKPTTISWLAYPMYKALTNPKEDLGTFVLARRLYYPNAIERAASCMEMAAISGRNVALLIAAEQKQEATAAPSSKNSGSKS